MKSVKITLSLSLLFFSISTFCQNNEDIIREFALATDNAKYLSKHSVEKYKLYEVNKRGDTVFNQVEQQILNAQIGTVLGPYENDSTIDYIKIVKVDSSYKVRVGNIWINIKRGREEAERIANQILADVRRGSNYSTLCHLYSDDKNIKQDCDLGWFYNTIMVKEFGDEIIKHKQGEVFIVKTQFGFHVVKILGQAYKDREAVEYVVLKLKK